MRGLFGLACGRSCASSSHAACRVPHVGEQIAHCEERDSVVGGDLRCVIRMIDRVLCAGPQRAAPLRRATQAQHQFDLRQLADNKVGGGDIAAQPRAAFALHFGPIEGQQGGKIIGARLQLCRIGVRRRCRALRLADGAVLGGLARERVENFLVPWRRPALP